MDGGGIALAEALSTQRGDLRFQTTGGREGQGTTPLSCMVRRFPRVVPAYRDDPGLGYGGTQGP